ncbi:MULTISPECIES: hypothetical protein [Microbacterium]|uniref:hypothetical protein n=1 Tax=Microbacterium TaxID=33882 RepID=UPI002786252A|nr:MULTISPECIES: hypothetical protein [Microbacterium]MDQ1082286.1 hypothetical protein [Microbacterium sp. SORGH_AS_0344]MDQ1168942.1 hypothetical protein [Microbacterium proteolyticum]
MTTPAQLDTAPLTGPVDKAAVRAFTAELRTRGALRGRTLSIVILSLVGLAFALVVVPIFLSIAVSFVAGDSGDPLVALPLIVVLAIVVIVAVTILRGFGAAAVRRYRLDRFARANGMTWHPGYSDPPLPGMIFDIGRDRGTHDLMRRETPRFVEVANYSYETGSGKNKQTHRWGYAALRLDTPLPHIVLDAVGNNGLFGGSNLPVTFGRAQRLSLEGDFDQHFALYCPEGYERDALYLFTPDVMARFIDNAAQLDVEIIDDWLFLYSRRDLSTLDSATWQWVMSTIAALDDKLAQWARWRDERLTATPTGGAAASGLPQPSTLLTPPPAGVAAPGRRLRRGFSWVTVVVALAVGGWWLFSIVVDVLGN